MARQLFAERGQGYADGQVRCVQACNFWVRASRNHSSGGSVQEAGAGLSQSGYRDPSRWGMRRKGGGYGGPKVSPQLKGQDNGSH